MAKLDSIIFSVFVCYLTVFTLCLAHGHSHDHGHAHGHHGHAHDHHGHADEHHQGHGEPEAEPASFRYSREANEQQEPEDLSLNKHDHHGHGHDEHVQLHTHHDTHSHDHGHAHHEHESGSTKTDDAKISKKDTGLLLWAQALSATAIISVAPVFILICIPIANAAEHQQLLKVLLSFASGGLLGDAFLHLIPHAISPHSHGGEGEGDHDQHGHESHDHGHSHEHGGHNMSVGLWVLGGIIAFLIVEKFVRMVKGEHGHSHGVKAVSNKNTPSTSNSTDNVTKSKKDKTSDDDKKSKTKKTDKSSHKPVEPKEDIKVAGYLNLAADFAHNFTDGLAIGASFLLGRNIGIITAVTIFLHEIPHEIGDFAILIQSGCSKKKAMLLQFSTAIGAMIGTVSSLLAEGADAAATAWILPFTAGGFIYIATVSVIPELLEDSKLWQSIKEIIALLVGVYMMVLIAAYE